MNDSFPLLLMLRQNDGELSHVFCPVPWQSWHGLTKSWRRTTGRSLAGFLLSSLPPPPKLEQPVPILFCYKALTEPEIAIQTEYCNWFLSPYPGDEAGEIILSGGLSSLVGSTPEQSSSAHVSSALPLTQEDAQVTSADFQSNQHISSMLQTLSMTGKQHMGQEWSQVHPVECCTDASPASIVIIMLDAPGLIFIICIIAMGGDLKSTNIWEMGFLTVSFLY